MSGGQVAWINGVGGSLLMAVGAFLMGMLPLKVDVRIAFCVTALLNQLTLSIHSGDTSLIAGGGGLTDPTMRYPMSMHRGATPVGSLLARFLEDESTRRP